jgi:hypothetical protein
MFYFLIYTCILILLNSLWSLKNFSKIQKVYNNLKFYRFKTHGSLIIANEGSKDEFVVVNDWNFRLPNDQNLHFDIWTLVDFHRLYWLIKFHNQFNKDKTDTGSHILFF